MDKRPSSTTFDNISISYAVWWIRQAILQALTEQTHIVRRPYYLQGNLTRISQILNGLEQKLGRIPNADEIADELEMEPDEVERLLDLALPAVSLDAPYGNDESNLSLLNRIPDESWLELDQALFQDELKTRLRLAMQVLTERESQVIQMHYGLDRQEPMTLEAIGVHFGLSRERIRQLKAGALQKLKHPARSGSLRGYYTV